MVDNYILIDFENIQPKAEALSFLEDSRYKILIFIGAKQTVSIDRVNTIQPLGKRAQYIQIKNSGKNALDFHIAYYLGMLACQKPESMFYVVSKDTGYDALLAYMRTHKLKAQRVDDISKIGQQPIAKTKSVNPVLTLPVVDEIVQASMQKGLEKLKTMGNSRPRLVKTLTTTLKSTFRDILSDQQLSDLIQLLQQKQYISISGQNKISYNFKDK